MNIDFTEVIDVSIVGAESNSFSMFFGTDVKIVIFIVFLTDGAEGVLRVRPRKHLCDETNTSWLCFSRESRICFW